MLAVIALGSAGAVGLYLLTGWVLSAREGTVWPRILAWGAVGAAFGALWGIKQELAKKGREGDKGIAYSLGKWAGALLRGCQRACGHRRQE